MPQSFRCGPWQLTSVLDQASSLELLDAVCEDRVDRLQVFRDNWRTLSARVRFRDNDLLLKVPRARNDRRWERFLTRFRGSDAMRSFRHLELMAAMGFSAPKPVMACERRDRGAVTDSFVCYHFVEGRPARADDAPRVLDALRALHQRGYLRTDAQIANFLVRGETVVFIDFRLKKPRLMPGLQKARELDRFIRSCPEAVAALTEQEALSGWLRIARWLENLSFLIRRLKRRARGQRTKSKA